MASGFLRKHLRQFVSAANRYACAGTILGLLSVTFFSANLYAYPQVVLDKAKVGSKDINSRELFDLSKSRSSLEASGKASLRSVREKEEIEGFLAVARKSEAQRVKEEVIEKRVVKAYSLAVQASKEFLEAAPNIEIAQLFSVGDLDNPDRIRAHRGTFTEIFKSDALPRLVVGGEFEGSISTLAGFVENVDGHPTIFLNPYWAQYLTEGDLVPILVEELGHFIDQALFGDSVLDEDEGLQFARAVLPSTSPTFYRELSRFRGEIAYKNKRFSAEFASFTFAKTFKVTNVADAQTSSHDFDYKNDLGPSRISDGGSTSSFTANDIAAQLYFFNDPNNPVYGYVTRPIKTGSTYRAVYMYTDTDYDSLNKVLEQGPNSDSDGTNDNNGYILVFDGDYFETNYSSVGPDSEGSSSDPIKSALNDLIKELQPVSISDDSVTEGGSLIHTVTWGATCGNGGKNPCVPPVDVLLTFDQEDVTTSVITDYNGTPALSGGVTKSNGYLLVPDGTTSFTITYTTLDDSDSENTETYKLSLETLSATGTIVDNETSNAQPTAVNDSNSVNAGATLTVADGATGDVLLNDSDSDSDTLTVLAIRTGAESATDGTSGTVGQALTGTYGSLTLNANGSYTYVASAQTPTNSDLDDVFTYTASDGNGGTDTAELKIQVLISSQTLAKVVTSKTGTADSYAVGDVVTYTITQTNTGNVTLNNVVITDAKLTASSTAGKTGSCASVAPSATCVLEGTFTITQTEKDAGTFKNMASVKSDEIPTALEDSNTITLAQSPAQTLAKVVSSKTGTAGAYAVGDVVTYTITQTNTGNVTLNNVVITDDKIIKSTTSGETGSCTSVAPSATCILVGTYTITQTEKDAGTFKNTASVKSDEIPTALEDSNTITLAQSPAQTLAKVVSSKTGTAGAYAVGDVVTYTITQTNTGNVTLNNVVITDDKIIKSTTSGETGSCTSVAPSATCILVGTYTITQTEKDAGTFTNTASVKSDEIPTALEDSNTITLAQSAAQTLAKVVTSKTGTADSYAVGDVATYTITQTNTGNVTLNNVVITDDKVTKSTTSGETGSCTSVAPSATCILVGTYTITQTEKDAGTFKNTASVKSTEIPTALEASNTITLAANAKPTLSKTLTSNADEDKTSTITVGDTLTYTVTLLNDGDVTITDTTITDDKVSPSSASCSSVAVNGTCVLTGTYKVTQADVDAGKVTNNAASTSKNPGGDTLTREASNDRGDHPERGPNLSQGCHEQDGHGGCLCGG